MTTGYRNYLVILVYLYAFNLLINYISNLKNLQYQAATIQQPSLKAHQARYRE